MADKKIFTPETVRDTMGKGSAINTGQHGGELRRPTEYLASSRLDEEVSLSADEQQKPLRRVYLDSRGRKITEVGGIVTEINGVPVEG